MPITPPRALRLFERGKKEIYLPSFSIALHRGKSPRHATFTVPLWFNKLDLRDYLYSVYNVRVYKIASYIRLSPVTQGNQNDERLQATMKMTPRRWHRPQSTKTMTVELVEPFIWPEEPTDLEQWHKTEAIALKKSEKMDQKRYSSTRDTVVNTERRESLREQAQALLDGKEKWQPYITENPGMPTAETLRR